MRPIALISVLACVATGCGKVDATTDGGPTVACDPTTHTVSVLPNGSFDAPTPAWTQNPPSILCGSPLITPFDGTTAACLGGKDGVVDTLSQSITLPAGVNSLTLNGQECISTKETAAVDNDVLSFDILFGENVLATIGKFSNQQGVATCQFTAFTKQTPVTTTATAVTFRIQSTLNDNNTTSFFIDALTLTAGCAP
jgi:hypothetical protein